MLSKRASQMKPSPTLFLVAKAKELSLKGHDVISLSVGEPDWQTIRPASLAGIQAIEEGFSKYTPAAGLPELREAICKQVKADLNLDYSIKNVTVATGAKFILFAALQMLIDPGDEVVLQSPYWVSYPMMTEMCDGKPVIIECHHNSSLKMTAQQLDQAITKKTKAFIHCSPSNPTGVVYTKEELKSLAEVLRKHPHVLIITDDIYNRLYFKEGEALAPHILQVAPDLKDRTLIVNGASKSYAMTGWRIGWALGPEKLITAMADYQSQTTSSASSISQKAALAAVQNGDSDVRAVVKMLKERMQPALQALRELPGITVVEPQGAFYLWLNVEKTFGKKYQGQTVKDSRDFAAVLLDHFYVATVPGAEFGAEGFLRLSFAIGTPRMLEAIARMRKMLGMLS